MKKYAVHKILMFTGGRNVMSCGTKDSHDSAYGWNKVTCKNCLKTNPNK